MKDINRRVMNFTSGQDENKIKVKKIYLKITYKKDGKLWNALIEGDKSYFDKVGQKINYKGEQVILISVTERY